MGCTLFDLSDDLLALEDLLEAAGGELTPELEAAYEALLGDRGTLTEKVDGYAALIAEITNRADVRKAEAKRLADLAKIDENKAKALKGRLKVFFDRHGLKDLQTKLHRFSVVKSGGARQVVLPDDLDPASLSSAYATPRVVYEIDKDALRAALEELETQTAHLPEQQRGDVFEHYGVPRGAYLAERGTNLRIK